MRTTFGRLLGLGDAPRGRVLLASALGTLAILCGVGLMTTAGYLIARAAERPAILSLTVAIVAVRFFGLARPVVRYLDRLDSHDLAFRVLARIRVRFYERIEPLAPAGLEEFRRGDLVSRMVGDVDALQNLYLRGLAPVLAGAVAAAISAGVAAAILPEAGLALAAGLLAAGVGVSVLAALLARAAGRRRASLQGCLSAELVESFHAAPELVVYGREHEALARIRDLDHRLVRVARRDSLVAGLADALVILVTGATVVAVLALAIAAHGDGRIDRVSIAVLALLALASFDAVAPLPQAARELSTTLAAGRRVLELTDREASVRDPDDPVSPTQPSLLELENVVARYSADEPEVLAGASLTLRPGKSVALVGSSGAGKTTIVNLLLRFLDPERGRVTLGGRDLRDYRQSDVRDVVAVAGQDSHIFSTSIRENVRLGSTTADDEQIEESLRRARIWDWVESLPDGMDTLVGENGSQLSGGQRQRIALARALLRDAPVLVLDEPTSQLDSDTAKELVRDMVTAAGERSVLLVTHRPEGLDLVDEVLVLERGRIEKRILRA